MCEIPSLAFARASLVVIDELAAVLAEAGDVLQAMEAGQVSRDELVEIGSLLDGGQFSPPGGLTIFKSVGIAAQDWALGELVVSRSRQHAAAPADDGECA
jgi:ornithine cyclodeaminase